MNKNKIIFLSAILFIFGSIIIYGSILSLKVNCDHLSMRITIEQGSTVDDVSRILENNLCINSILFKIAMKITFNEKNIKYGRYDFKSVNNMRDIVELITSIPNNRTRVTIFEGFRMQEIAKILNKKMNLDVEKFVSICYDKDFIKSLGLGDISSLEGYLYPDTYIFLNTYTEEDIIHIMIKQFFYNFNEYVQNKTSLSIHEIITLGSIIQGEAMYVDEMNIISSVYHNRLKKDMLLQADPTIQYLMPKQKKRLLYKDTQIDNEYNTYLYKGLPPGPINSPGIDAIVAAANPASTNFLYFVANKNGRHIFNKTYKGHLKSR